MVTKLDDAFRFQEAALNLRAWRQEVLASNIANADTPNYKARDIDFSAQLRAAVAGTREGEPAKLATTDSRHIGAAPPGSTDPAGLKYRIPYQASVDGNTVEMDQERAQFADNAVRYETSLTVLGMRIKSLLSAIQG
jgi:flagellar basal-body rod protein FlgB